MSTFAPAPRRPALTFFAGSSKARKPGECRSHRAFAPRFLVQTAFRGTPRLCFQAPRHSRWRMLLLLLTANLSVAWSNAKLLSQDEIFVLQTDSVASLRQLLDVQRHAPISLDPLLYHLFGFVFAAPVPCAHACGPGVRFAAALTAGLSAHAALLIPVRSPHAASRRTAQPAMADRTRSAPRGSAGAFTSCAHRHLVLLRRSATVWPDAWSLRTHPG